MTQLIAIGGEIIFRRREILKKAQRFFELSVSLEGLFPFHAREHLQNCNENSIENVNFSNKIEVETK